MSTASTFIKDGNAVVKHSPKFKDLSGKRYGRLVVIRFFGKTRQSKSIWLCQCDCGQVSSVRAKALVGNQTRSCGCLRVESVRKFDHGDCRNDGDTKEYRIWRGMRRRCFDSRQKDYKNYGARGIVVCERWMKYENFLSDMGRCPEEHCLERINNDGNYEPSNCRWATIFQQANNRRGNRILTFNGESKTCAQWAYSLNINPATILGRLWRKWSVEKTLTETLLRQSKSPCE